MRSMELIWPEADAWTSLERALSPAIDHARAALPELEAITIRPGPADGPQLTLTDSGLLLRADILGPGMHARTDRDWLASEGPVLAPLALDRWRRAAGLLLEGLILHRLARQHGCAPSALPLSWRTLGWAAEWVDRLDPELGWLWQPAVGLLSAPQRGLAAAPRRAAWLFRWLATEGRAVSAEALLSWAPAPAEWAAFGAWCRDRTHGPDAGCPVTLPIAAPGKPPAEAEPLSHHPVAFTADAAGLRLHGPALAETACLAGGTMRVLALGSVEGEKIVMQQSPGVASGTWSLASGELGQRVGAARGVELVLRNDGVVDISLANAFVGPVSGDVLSLASRFGASGFGGGRWSATALDPVVGSGALTFTELTIEHLTIHPRKGLKFALPGQAWLERLRNALNRLNNRPLRYTLRGRELRLETSLRGSDLMLRLERAR